MKRPEGRRPSDAEAMTNLYKCLFFYSHDEQCQNRLNMNKAIGNMQHKIQNIQRANSKSVVLFLLPKLLGEGLVGDD